MLCLFTWLETCLLVSIVSQLVLWIKLQKLIPVWLSCIEVLLVVGIDEAGNPIQQKQEMKTAYISSALDLILAAQRFNNHRPYIMAGINPMMNLNSKNEDYIKLKKTDLFLELGLGCDFYLPYFKLRPELKFMYGITDTYDKNHIKNIKDKSTLPYTLSAKSAHSKIIALTFYFE
jgi:hypothetical protein